MDSLKIYIHFPYQKLCILQMKEIWQINNTTEIFNLMIWSFFFYWSICEVLASFQSSNEHRNWKLSIHISTFKWIYLLWRAAKGRNAQGNLFRPWGSARREADIVFQLWSLLIHWLTWHSPSPEKEEPGGEGGLGRHGGSAGCVWGAGTRKWESVGEHSSPPAGH